MLSASLATMLLLDHTVMLRLALLIMNVLQRLVSQVSACLALME
jgi:hypothetical protein